jgi:hypothetical protein
MNAAPGFRMWYYRLTFTAGWANGLGYLSDIETHSVGTKLSHPCFAFTGAATSTTIMDSGKPYI